MSTIEQLGNETWTMMSMESQDQLVQLAMRGEQSGLSDDVQKTIAAEHLKSLFSGIWDVNELNHNASTPVQSRQVRGNFKTYLGSFNPNENGWLDF